MFGCCWINFEVFDFELFVDLLNQVDEMICELFEGVVVFLFMEVFFEYGDFIEECFGLVVVFDMNYFIVFLVVLFMMGMFIYVFEGVDVEDVKICVEMNFWLLFSYMFVVIEEFLLVIILEVIEFGDSVDDVWYFLNFVEIDVGENLYVQYGFL